MMLLHAEQYLEIKRPIPINATFEVKSELVDVIDKGSGCIVINGAKVYDERGHEILYTEYSNFVRGAKHIGTKQPRNRGAASANFTAPQRAPDAVVQEKTNAEQAALYRLSGDVNPLHIDPQMSAMGGFEVPILHGLCTFGIAGKHIIQKFANGEGKRLKSIKVRLQLIYIEVLSCSF